MAEIVSLGFGNQERTADQIAGIFPAVPETELRSALSSAYGDSITWSFNGSLIRIGDNTILVDTGFGFAEAGPRLATSRLLADAGVSPDEVGTVVITHGHGDHVGGLLHDGAAGFTSAKLVMSVQEYAFWMGPASAELMGEERVRGQREAFTAYAGRTKTVEPDGLIWGEAGGDRVQALDARGHTPGHIGIEVVSGDERIRLIVDSAHSLIQMEHPEWSPSYDRDPDMAQSARKRIFEEAADSGVLVHAYHFPFPGFGTIERTETGFAFRSAGE